MAKNDGWGSGDQPAGDAEDWGAGDAPAAQPRPTAGRSASPKGVAMPAPSRYGSVLENAPPDPEAWDREMVRQSRRDAPQPANTPASPPPRRLEQYMQPAPEIKPRGVGGAVADTVLGLGQGAVGLVKGVADNWNAGGNPVSETLGKSIQGLDYLKSDELRNTLIQRDGVIQQARRNGGELAAARAALNTMFVSPMAAGDVAAQGAGSLLPIVGMSALRPAAMWATNALANAGSSASETADALRQLPPSDWQNDAQYVALVRGGATHEDAVATLAPIYALPSQGIGFLTGALSGRTGVERALAGRAAGNTMRSRAGSAGAELLGEQAETLAPQAVGNLTVGGVDQRTGVTEGLGQASVDTLAGAAPGAGLAAALPRQGQQAPQPSAEQMARDRGFLKPADRPVTAPIDAIAPAQTTDEAIVAAARALDEQSAEDTRFQAMQDAQALESQTDQSAQAVANIGRILESQNVVAPADAMPTELPATKPAGPQAAPGVGTAEPAPALAPPPSMTAEMTAPAAQVASAGQATPRAELVPETAPATVEVTRSADGGMVLKGDAKQIMSMLAAEGLVGVPSRSGVRVATSAAPQAQEMAAKRAGAPAAAPQVVQGQQAAQRVQGAPIDREWSAFTPESGTRGVPRADMPQIKAEHRGALTQFVHARGIQHEQVEVPARDLKPTQAEFSPAKVQRAKGFDGGDRSILISADGYILDGHHQWLAKLEAGEPVKAIRLDAPIEQLLAEVKEFPSARTAAGAAEVSARAVNQQEKPDAQERRQQGAETGQAATPIPTDQAADAASRVAGMQPRAVQPDRADADWGAADEPAPVAPTNSLQRTASWVIKNKATGEVVMETFNQNAVKNLNTDKYEAVPIQKYLGSLNRKPAAPDQNDRRAAGRGPDRRQDAEQRRRVQDMDAEELRRALLTSDLTGIQNRRAWDDAEKKANIASIDADSLKWLNDNLSPDAGDGLLKAVAARMSDVFPAGDIFHISGDEFIAMSDDAQALRQGMARVQELLDNDTITETKPDGTVITKTGLAVTTGYGKDKGDADQDLKREKRDREARGERAGRGEEPPGVVRRKPARVPAADRAGQPGDGDAVGRQDVQQRGARGQGIDEGPQFSRASADQTDTPEFKRWFGDSKVVDAIGKPRVVYHGSPDARFVNEDGVFSTPKERMLKYGSTKESRRAAQEEAGYYFTTSQQVAKTYANPKRAFDYQNAEHAVIPAYLSISNPLVFDAGGKHWREAQKDIDKDDFIKKAKRDGHDGVLIKNVRDNYGSLQGGRDPLSDVFVAFKPEQIKSATGNSGAFDPANPDIRFSEGRRGAANPSTVTRVQSAVSDLLGGKQLANSLGRVVATTAADIKTTWEPLIGKNVQIGSEGEAGIAQGFYEPRTKTVFLIADNINQGDEGAVLAHELMHKHGQAVLGEAGWNRMHGMISNWKDAPKDSAERRVYDYAAGKVAAVGQELSTQELFPYAVEGAIKQGVKPSMAAKRGTVAYWLESVRQNLKEVWGRITGKPETFKTQDLMDLAFGIAQMESPDGEVLRGALAAQTETPAFKRWFGDSVVTENGEPGGKPLVVYHGTNKSEGGDAFTIFDTYASNYGLMGQGGYFTADPAVASSYTTKGRGDAPTVYPVYLSIKNPIDMDGPADAEAWQRQFPDAESFHEEGDTNESWYRAAEESLRDEMVPMYEGAEAMQDGLRAMGFDGITHMGGGRLDKASVRHRVYVAFDPEQIKSAIGNSGAFDPANPDIRFSRGGPAQPPGATPARKNSPWRDVTGRLQFAPGQWLFDKIDQGTSPVLNWKYLQLKGATPELRRMLNDMKLQVEKAQETAAAVAGEAFKLTDAERAMVSDLVEKELQAGVTPPAHAVQLAAMINEAMGRQTDELIRLGMLTKDAAEKWRGQYLPRYYETKLGKKLQDVWADSIGKMFRQPRAMQGIRGKHLKGRGMYQTIPGNQLADYEALGWEVRDADYQPGLTGDGTVQVWRDFTRQERDKMGEIRDAGFRFVMGYMQTQKDIALGQLYEGLAANSEMSSRTETEKFSAHVPDTKVTGTGAHVYGKLAGRWVSPETMSQLSKGGEEANEALMMYRKAMSYWKQGKTSMNPVAHANNVFSNITMAHLAGVSYWRPDSYVGAIRDLVNKDPMVKEAKDAGLFLGSMSDTELMNTMPEQLRVLAGQQDGAAAKAGKTVWNLMTLWLSTPMGKAYQAEDSFFRYLIYRDARQRGVEPRDAVDYAQRYIFTYDDLPKGARMIRDFGMPFFAYTYKAIPALLHTALTHPDRLAAPAAVLGAVNAAAYALSMDDDDDWLTKLKRYVTDSEFREKVREAEKLERRYLPEWMKGTTSLGTPKTIRMGMDEVTALPLFMDMSRMMPGGDLFDVNPNAGGIPLPQPITPNHPFFTLGVGLLANKDLFLGKDLTDANDTSAEKAEKRLGWLWRQMSPAIAVNNYHWQRWMNALAQATDGDLKYVPDVIGGESTGIGRDGLPVQPKYAALQTVGIKLRPIDLDVSEQIEANQRSKMIRDIDAEIRSLKRLSGKGAINDATLEREMEKAQEKKARLREGLTIDGEEIE